MESTFPEESFLCGTKKGWISLPPVHCSKYAATTVLPVSGEELEPVAVAVAAAAAAAERSNSSTSCGCCGSGCSSTAYIITL